MTRRRHFPTIMLSVPSMEAGVWARQVARVRRLHGDALLVPTPWQPRQSLEDLVRQPRADLGLVEQRVDGARRFRLGVYLELKLPAPDGRYHDGTALAALQALHIRPLMNLDLSGVLIRDAQRWPAKSILALERLVRMKEGAVLITDAGRTPDAALMDGEVDAMVDPSGAAGLARFFRGQVSGTALAQHFCALQRRIGLTLAGRVFNPVEGLAVPADLYEMAVPLLYCLRGYPLLPPAPAPLPESIFGAAGQLRSASSALRYGRFVDLSPPDRPEVFAFARVDERGETPVVVVARRAPGPTLSIPLRLGQYDVDQPFQAVYGGLPPQRLGNGWLDLPPNSRPELLVLGQ